MSDVLEEWRTSATTSQRYIGSTAAEAIAASHAACGVGTLEEFKAWLDGHGLRPFDTGRGYVINIPHAPAHKLTAQPIPSDGSETY